MLSKVAERLYWVARYLERIENTARLVSVYDNLLFDLPRDIDISWYHLITLNSADELFEERYRVRDERNVVKFLLADDTNPASMLSALRMIRENVRTTRDVLPPETWEVINELYIYAQQNIQQGINRTARYEFLDQMIKGCQQITGLVTGTMSRDAPWHFLHLGRNLERADMATRLLDAGATALIQGEAEAQVAISQIIWGNVLRSSSADLSYRRTKRCAVKDREVAEFLLEDPHFPRSLRYCLSYMRDSLDTLPNSTAALKRLDQIVAKQYRFPKGAGLGVPFRAYLNQVQLDLNELHQLFNVTWFSLDQRGAA